MKDRPDLQEKVVRAHLISGAIVDVSITSAYRLNLRPSADCAAFSVCGTLHDTNERLIYSLVAFLYYVPTDLLLQPSEWSFSIPMGLAWVSVISALKMGWCLGYGRATAEQATKAGKAK
jgi:hypothetical protein